MATRTITTAIKLDGEAEFKKQMSSVNSELKTLSSELKLSESEFKGQANTVEALTAKDKVLTQQIDQQKEKVKALEQAVKDASEAYGDTDKRTDSYRQQLNNAKTALNGMNDDLKQNRKYMDEAKASSDGCASSIDEYGKEVKDAGDKTLSFGDIVKANLTSQAIIGGVKALANAAGSAAREFKDIVLAASDYGSEINDTSAKTGMATGSLQQWRYAAKLCGVDSDKLTSIMVKQQKSFSDASEGSKTASTAYQRLGIDIKKVGNSSDAFDLVMKKLAGMKDETTRNALANDIFGKSYADLSPLLAEGADGMDELKQKAQDLGIVMSDKAIKAADDFGDSLDTLKMAFSGLKNNLSGEFLPAITQVMDGMTQVMAGDTDAGIKAIKDGITDFGNQIDKMGPYAKQVLDLVVQVITDNLPSVIECAGKVITSLIDGLCKEMPELIPTVIDVILTIVDTLTDPKNLNNLTEGAVAIITQLALGLIAAMPKLIEKVPEIIENIVDTLTSKENIGKLKESGIEIVKALWNGILSMGDWLGNKIDRFVETYIHDHFVNSFGTGVNGTGKSGGGGRTVNGSHALGLDYVPFDGYIAELHRGERVLTAQEASVLSGLSSADLRPKTRSLSASEMQSIAAQSVNALMSGSSSQNISITVPLTIDGKEFARATISDYRLVSKSTPEVSLA
jgi:uncharacterized protein YoxC